jgi:hypothetical protein
MFELFEQNNLNCLRIKVPLTLFTRVHIQVYKFQQISTFVVNNKCLYKLSIDLTKSDKLSYVIFPRTL